MNFQIASIFIIQLLTFHEALTARVLSWSVDTSDPQNLTIGGTVKLKCTGPSCCSGSRSWIGGASSSTLMSNGVPINSSKYEEILDSNSFSLLIKHVAESDYNVSYQCFNKFDDSPSIELQPTNETFWYKPSQSDIKVISALDTIGGDVSFAVNVTKVFPDPDCEATIGSKTYLVQVITTDDPSVYMHCEVSMKDVIFSCPGSLRISCSAPPYVTFSINGGNPCPTRTIATTTQSSSTSPSSQSSAKCSADCIVITVITVLIISPIIGIIIFICVCRKPIQPKQPKSDEKSDQSAQMQDIFAKPTESLAETNTLNCQNSCRNSIPDKEKSKTQTSCFDKKSQNESASYKIREHSTVKPTTYKNGEDNNEIPTQYV